MLYHYTTWQACEGILSSCAFWATAHDCTNDASELRSTDSAAIEIANEMMGCSSRPGQILLKRFLSRYEAERATAKLRVFLICFSGARDKDSQWTAYAESGAGICLGLATSLPEDPPGSAEFGKAVLQVDYSSESWKSRIRSGFREVLGLYDDFTRRRNQYTDYGRDYALSALNRIAAYAATVGKYPKWKSEEEWRLIVLPRKNKKPDVKYREAPGRTVDYLEVPLRIDYLPIVFSEIMIGPNQDRSEGKKRIAALLGEAGYPSEFAGMPEVTFSNHVEKAGPNSR